MLKIKKTFAFLVACGGLSIGFFAAPNRAAAQFIPPGSYLKSCKNVKTVGATLEANCNPKDKYGEFAVTAPLKNYFECDGDIRNDDSVLKCNRNRESALMQAARKSITSSYQSVMGSGVASEAHLTQLIQMMFERGMGQKFYAGKYGFLIDTDLTKMFKDALSKKSVAEKRSVIERAYTYAYGRGPGAEQIARYLNQNIAFSEIIAAEQQLMKSDSTNLLRGIAIVNAYIDSMGRPPTPAERAYWNPKLSFYGAIVKASRDFMYSPNGSKDLLETIKRAHNASTGKNPDSVQLANLLTKYSQKRAIFDEMK